MRRLTRPSASSFFRRADHLRRCAGLRLEFLEAMIGHEELAQDQHRPALAHDGFCASHGTEGLVSRAVLVLHHVFFIGLETMIFIARWGASKPMQPAASRPAPS